MKKSDLGSVFIFQKTSIGLDNYKGKESLSRVVDTHYLKEFHKNSLVTQTSHINFSYAP